MTKAFLIITILSCVLNSYSQEFGTHWISYPIPNDSSEVLFSHVYTTFQRPRQAHLSFASSGKLKVYVNERNISANIYYQNPNSSTVCMYTYDITRFLRPDSNVISIWYAPQDGSDISKQLSLDYYGIEANGKPFFHKADGSWKCKILEGCYVKGSNETFDSRHYDRQWKATDYNREEWANPLGSCHLAHPYHVILYDIYDKRLVLSHVSTPTSVSEGQHGLQYDFGKVFFGTPRITLREAKEGQTISVDGFNYICNGELDEQAYRRFSTITSNSVTIHSDSHFKNSQITNIEALDYF